MYVSEIYANGFRCFGPITPLRLKLAPGLNILVGPNDAGKSAIIDAARYVLWTRGDDYIRPDERDFHVDEAGTRGNDFVAHRTGPSAGIWRRRQNRANTSRRRISSLTSILPPNLSLRQDRRLPHSL